MVGFSKCFRSFSTSPDPSFSFCFVNKLHFAQNSRKSVPIDDEYSSTSPLEGSDVSLSHGSNDLLFDISRSPLVDFHHYERVHRGTANQVEHNVYVFAISRVVI